MSIFKKTYTEADLIAGCKRNERTYQEKLYKQFFPDMMAYCVKQLGSQDLAMEVLNNGFLRVFKKIELYDPAHGALGAWIRTLVRHAIADYYRSQKNTVPIDFLAEQISSDFTEENEIIATIDHERVERILQVLPEKTRAVFKKYIIEGYSHQEIANHLHIAEGTSKWHVSEGKKILQIYLSKGSIQQFL